MSSYIASHPIAGSIPFCICKQLINGDNGNNMYMFWFKRGDVEEKSCLFVCLFFFFFVVLFCPPFLICYSFNGRRFLIIVYFKHRVS